MLREEYRKRARILVVDDEAINLTIIERILAQAGYSHVRLLQDPRGVLAAFDEFAPDLVILDLAMPHLDGVQVMEQLQDRLRAGDYLPLLILTGNEAPAARERALRAGATDFLLKPFDVTIAVLRVAHLLEIRFLQLELRHENRKLESRVQARTQELEDEIMARRLASDRVRLFEATLRCLKDPLLIVDAPPPFVEAQVLYANEAWKTVTGLGADAILGQPPRLVFDDEPAAGATPLPCPLAAALRDDGPKEGYSVRMRGASPRRILWSVSPVSLSSSAKPDHYVIVQRDVTAVAPLTVASGPDAIDRRKDPELARLAHGHPR